MVLAYRADTVDPRHYGPTGLVVGSQVVPVAFATPEASGSRHLKPFSHYGLLDWLNR